MQSKLLMKTVNWECQPFGEGEATAKVKKKKNCFCTNLSGCID